MGVIGGILSVVGILLAIAGTIWLVVLAFQESVLWGLGCLFLPIVGLVFAILHWYEARMPLLIKIGGGVLMFLGSVLASR